MFETIHNAFQIWLDKTIESDTSLENKMMKIKKYLLENQELYEQMMFSYFDKDTLDKDQYYYITYTYHDLPIDVTKPNQIVVSMLYDHDHDFYFEIAVLNDSLSGEERVETFNRATSFLN